MRRDVRGLRVAAVAAAGAMVAGLGVVATSPAYADGSANGWVPETAAAFIGGSTPVGDAPASTPVPVTVSLASQDPAGLQTLLAAQADPRSPEYHRYLTQAQYAAAYGPTPATIASVVDYLKTQGLTDVRVGAGGLAVDAVATPGTAAQAFHTTLRQYRRGRRTALANVAPAQVPSRLGGAVTAVVGLDQFTLATTQAERRGTEPAPATTATGTPAAAGDVIPLYPDQMASVYDATSLPTAGGTTLAVLAEGNQTPVVADLRTAEANRGLAAVPTTIVPVGSGPDSDTSNTQEWDLDTQSSTGIAGTVSRLYIYDPSSLNDNGITQEIQQWAADDHALVATASYGVCDSDAQSDGTTTAVDAALREAQAQGQAFFAASGDFGASCLLMNNSTYAEETQYPASSTYATGVGGTTLTSGGTSSAPTYGGETTWNRGSNGASSGGLSTVEARPSYAAMANTADVTDFNATAGTTNDRGVPDMAMDGDPNSGAEVVVNGSYNVMGGTSLSSPLAAGAWARMETAHGNNLGNAAANLYGLYNGANPSGAGATPGLHDVTTGNNTYETSQPGYSARTGYDLTTGLGTFDVAAVSQDLDVAATYVAPTFAADTPPTTGTVGTTYGYRFAATGSPSPRYAVGSGALPPGLTLDAATGVVSGTPTKAGSSSFTVIASNGTSSATSPTISVAIGEPTSGGDAVFQGSTGATHLAKPAVAMAVDPATGGYWLVASDGGVFAYNAPFLGSTGNTNLNQPIVGIAATADGGGYYLVAADGGVFAYGDARFQGSTGNLHLTGPVVGMAVDPATGGYWLAASDGGIFAFDAPFEGSAGALPLDRPVVGLAATHDGGGYWLDASDGGIFAYGDAPFQGSTGNLHLNQPIVGMAADVATGGYWLVASDGGVFAFDAPFYGSAGGVELAQPVVGTAATPSSQGYYLVASDGGLFSY